VYGISNSTSVIGVAGNAATKALVAQGYTGQTTNLQEWQNNSGTALSVVDKSGNLGVGTGSPSAPLHVYFLSSPGGPNPFLMEVDNASTAASMEARAYGVGPGFLFHYAKGTKASPTDVSVGDRIGFVVFGGYAGGAFRNAAAINAIVDAGAVNSTSLPTYLQFMTTPNGSISRLERMRIDESGNVGIGTIAPKSPLHVVGLPVYAKNADAVAGGLTPGAFYRTGGDPDQVCMVH